MRQIKPELTDAQWARIDPLLPRWKPSRKGGRPWADNRACFEGILWILRTGSPWRDMPERYPDPATCWRRLRKWETEGVWEQIWRTYLVQLDHLGVLGWEECFIDASFSPAKRGDPPSVRHVKARERSGWWLSAEAEYLSESTIRLQALATRLSPKQRSKLLDSLDRDPAALARILRSS